MLGHSLPLDTKEDWLVEEVRERLEGLLSRILTSQVRL